MVQRLMKKDFKKNKVIVFTLFTFILLSAMLLSSALTIATELTGSLDHLFEKAKVPSYVQMYAGDFSQDEINTFSENNELVKNQQTVTMLNIDGESLFLQVNGDSEVNSIIENSFVKQNEAFDFLLDSRDEIAGVHDGEIGIPVYHQQLYNLELGSKVQVQIGDFKKTYTITSFIRDAQMNPSLVTSKRFLVSDNDWNELETKLSNQEHLIEFELNDDSSISEFEKQYEASNLPQSGTALTKSLYQVLNALTDGIVIAIIILISLLLLLIASLCLRFTILTAIEEDYREIGIMKATGISNKNIRKLYLTKYIVIASIACLGGYLASLAVTNVFTKSMSVYMGLAPKTMISYFLPLLGSLLVFLFVYLFCRLVFRRFKKISAYQALQAGEISGNRKIAHRMQLSGKKHWIGNHTIFIGIREVLTQIKTYILLMLVFAISLFMMSVPFNFLQTIQDSSFISYMGAGESDLRIDIHQMDKYKEESEEVFRYLTNESLNNDVIEKVASYETSAYQMKNADHEISTIKIESSKDYDVFPLHYTDGRAPQNDKEIALSSMNADEFEVSVGDTVTIILEGKEEKLTVSGIYQDVTNGGKTAKGMLESDDVLWTTYNFNVKDASKINEVKTKLEQTFTHIKVTDMDNYIKQTLGGIIEQVTSLSVVSFALSLFISILITSMFFKMILAKEAKNIAIMKSIGISTKTLQRQYIVRALFTLLIGLIVGVVLTNVLGTQVGSLLLSGVSKLTFVTNPLINYLIIPFSLVLVVSLSVYIVSVSIKKMNIMLIAE
ncbi:FtsX-like permease family protein [Faecalicatena sp. AGMB00832]|uniref:FtsX-like permease family protein n=1 Tax=Faecalicatena faecalis TaxID=2726362 RepID=A0ABS6D2U4_9FIRM|nr:FtsX-like permease family protein [Faecalicatena faecalis]MBU3875908.1 FtsX-like permease family protein [Faecalicatena faecalis]